jgi:hypothetical protein
MIMFPQIRFLSCMNDVVSPLADKACCLANLYQSKNYKKGFLLINTSKLIKASLPQQLIQNFNQTSINSISKSWRNNMV